MGWFAEPDWQAMFTTTVPLLEIVIRGSLMYLALFCLVRLFKRQAGSIGLSDLLVIMLIADAAQNGMAGTYNSVPDGIALATTIIFWNIVLDYLGYRFPALEKILHPDPLPLIKNGRFIRKNMRSE